MSKDFINPAGIQSLGAYTHVVTVTGGKLIYIAGQVAFDGEGNLVGGDDLGAQAHQVYANLRLALEAAGAGFEDLVKITAYIVNYRPEYRAVLGEVRSQYVLADPPASTLVGVQALALPELLIEIEAVAAVD